MLFSTLLIALNINAQLKQPKLIGIWQDAPMIASGWSQNYQFFADGSFNFNHNQMDCADSILFESGSYKIKKHGKVILRFSSQTIIAGGELIPSTGSCGSEFELVGGKEKTISVKEKRRLLFDNIKEDSENHNIKTTTINGVQFWKMGIDPNEYF